MTSPKTDLRVIRTRKLIMDSFIELSSKKNSRILRLRILRQRP